MVDPSPPPASKTSKVLTYEAALAKGTILRNAMLSPSGESSRFTSQVSLQIFHYTRQISQRVATDFLGLDNLHLLSGSPLTIVLNQHTNPSAHFHTAIDHDAGLLVAVVTEVAEQTRPDVPVPDLKHWSDIAYLQWTDPSISQGTRELKFVLRSRIENKDTMSVVERIVRDCGGSATGQRSFTWDMQRDEAKALLGTPNGSGVAWLLAQHKEQLGHKTVDEVTLFWDEECSLTGPPSLLFQLGDVRVGDDESAGGHGGLATFAKPTERRAKSVSF